MKKIYNKVADNIAPIIESLILLSCIFAPLYFDLTTLLKEYLNNSEGNIILFFIARYGKYALIIALFFFVLHEIRKFNGRITMNRRNVYHNYPYLWYLYCAKILEIKKCNLVLVPIYMQFKLVIQNVFDDFPMDEKEYPLDNEESIVCSVCNHSEEGQEINLILEDTYLLEPELIPEEKQSMKTIKISRNNGKKTSRHYSPKFIEAIVDISRSLPDGIQLNVFATTNPMNTMYIAKKAFKLADRGNIRHLYVFQQMGSEPRTFKPNGKKIY